MFPANITRAEVQARSALVRTEAYEIVVDLTGRDTRGKPLERPDEQFPTTSTIRFTAEAGTTHVDVIADQIVIAELDGSPIDTSGFNGHRLPLRLSAGAHVLTVTALHRFSRSGQGLHRFVDPADDRIYHYTQFESADARRVYANFEQPDLKATFTISVVAPKHWLVLSNAIDPQPSPVGAEFARWDFPATKRISTYLTAIVAGEYHREPGTIQSAAGEIPASVVCRASLAEHLDADRVRDITQAGFEVFEKHFDFPFPFDSYDQAFVPEYNAGAMENAGLITFRDDLIFRSRATSAQYENRDNTILHELAHMWFGDLVTPRWWDDLWLKESFAEWASHFAQSEILPDPNHAWASFCNGRKTWAYRADQLPSTHPIAADMVDLEAVELNFDGITYAKGASALRQLVAFVGRDPFLAGARAYFKKHAWGNTELSDLLAALEKASGRDLSGWSAQWLESTGVNTLRPEFAVSTGKDRLLTDFAITQSAAPDHPTLRDHRIGIGLYSLTDEGLRRVYRVETDISGERTPVPELEGQERPDLILVNDDDLTFAKVRLDARSLLSAVTHLDKVDNELTRALIWSSAWDMCRDAEMTAADYVDLVIRGSATEHDQIALSRAFGQALVVATRFVPAALGAKLRGRLTAGLARLLRDAAPGSDHQLAFARALADTIDTEVGAVLIKGWLAGEEVPPYLAIDADLRWHLISNLARMGAISAAEVDAELERDNTISGAEKAAGAKAAMPVRREKALAWLQATSDPDIPNETHRQICLQFWQPGQEDLLAEYVDRYFDLAEVISGKSGVWETMGSHLAQNALRYLYPGIVSEEFLTRLDEWLKVASLQPPARRIIDECRDDTQRALRAREFNKG